MIPTVEELLQMRRRHVQKMYDNAVLQLGSNRHNLTEETIQELQATKTACNTALDLMPNSFYVKIKQKLTNSA